jgi:hypothetical protein
MLRSYGDVLKARGVKKSASVSFDAAVTNEQMRTPEGSAARAAGQRRCPGSSVISEDARFSVMLKKVSRL